MSKKLTRSIIGFCLFLLGSGIAHAQSGDCHVTTPFYVADLSNAEDAVYISPSVVRDSVCCGLVSGVITQRCVEFEVTLHPNSLGFIFDIETGLIPSGVNFYNVDCASPMLLGGAHCTNDEGPFTVTYCKPGSFPNTFRIESISSNVTADTVTTMVDCTVPLEVTNLIESTITWNDITSGTSAYNSYLDCTAGCSMPNMLPDASAPAFIDYEVCGTIENMYCPTTAPSICDTLRVIIMPELQITNIDFLNGFCPTQPGLLLTAMPNQTGGDYVYWWSGVGPTADNTFFATTPGFYNVVIEDEDFGSCSRDTFNFIVFHQTPSPKINISPFGACPGATLQISADDAGAGAFYDWDFGPDATPQFASGIGPHDVSFSICGFQEINLDVTLDGCQGNIVSYAFVVDNDAPVITVDDTNLVLECGSTIPSPPPASTIDNCDNTPSLTFLEEIIPGICNVEYLVRWTWTATDTCGNIAQSIKEISLEDNDPPTLSQYPLDLTLECGDSAPLPPTITATDNCDVFPQVNYSQLTLPAPSGCAEEYILERTWIASDDCGNDEIHVQTILFEDNDAPTISNFNSLVTYDCDDTAPGLGSFSTDDDCSSSVSVSHVDSPCDNSYSPPYYIDVDGEVQLIGESYEPVPLTYPGTVANLSFSATCTAVLINLVDSVPGVMFAILS